MRSKIENKFNSDYNKSGNFKLNIDDKIGDYIAVMESHHLAIAINESLELMIDGTDGGDILISAEKLENEDTTILHIKAPPNATVAKMATKFNENQDNLIDALKFDVKDLLLRMAIAASSYRMVNGKMSINIGSDNSILMAIALPNKVQREE